MPPRVRGDDVEAGALLRPGPCGSDDYGWRRSTAKRDSLGSECEGDGTGSATRKKVYHEAKNWPILTHCYNEFNKVKRIAVLTEASTCVPALTPFVANVTARCLHLCSFRWNREKGERSTAPAGYNKGMPWGRRCSAFRSCRC